MTTYNVQDVFYAAKWLASQTKALRELERILGRKITDGRLERAEELSEIASTGPGMAHELDGVKRALGMVPVFSELAYDLMESIREKRTREQETDEQMKRLVNGE